MNKPDTPLHEKSYPVDWKAWIGWWIRENKYDTLESALKGTIKETKGLINPNWIIEAYNGDFK